MVIVTILVIVNYAYALSIVPVPLNFAVLILHCQVDIA